MIPTETIAQMLISFGLVDECAWYDPEFYDGYRTAENIGRFADELRKRLEEKVLPANQPLMMTVTVDTLIATVSAIENGLEYAQECLSQHDGALGRTTKKNKRWAEMMEADIREFNRLLELFAAWNIKPTTTPPAEQPK